MPKDKSPLLEKKEDQAPQPGYSKTEIEYLGGLRERMEDARNTRDTQHEEFDGMSYISHYEENERLANTFIKPKVNKEDTNFQSGVIRQKLFALLSSITNLDLRGDISAFSKDGFEVQAVGDAMEDIILKTNELDTDDEKKVLRHYELLKQGTVFVEEIWDEKTKKEKKTKKFKGKLKGFENIESKIKEAFARPARNIIPGLNVYLGDITKYDISEQPFIFTVDTMPYEEAKRMFGEWDRWENVPRTLQRFEESKKGLFNYDWRLLEINERQVEIIRYQDKWNNEFALLLNGVLMTPVGLPLPWGYEEYNIAQQNLEPIHTKFAYGKSLVARTKNKVAILDEAQRLAILKNQKSFAPPRYNLTGRMMNNRVLMPGKFVYGVPPGSLPPIEGENEGVTQAEFSMIKYLEETINSETVSPTFQGQQAEGNPTATEIIELQRQAKMVLGQTIFAVSMLEWKLEWLRLKNILVNWFVAEDSVVDDARGLLKNKYRKVTTNMPIEGEGMGQRIVIPTKEIPSSQAIMQTENYLSQEQGVPTRLIFLNPEEVCSSKLTWQIVIRPKERRSSETDKLLFRAFLQDAQMFGPMLNLPALAEEFASVWNKNPSKIFLGQEEMQMNQMQQAGQGSVSPETNLPKPEAALNRNMKTALGMTA